MLPTSLQVSQTAQSGADGDIDSSGQFGGRSGIFELGRISVATGKSTLSQTSEAMDGAAKTNPWRLALGAAAIAAFVYFVARK